jgi:PAS domain S-box-containing protein
VTLGFVPLAGETWIQAIVRDVSERKLAEAALRDSEERHRALFETMAQGVVYQDADGRITSGNPAAQRILGMSLAQMQGRTSIDPRWRAIHEDGSDFPGDTHPAMVALRTGDTVRNVVMGVFHPEEEEYRWININAVPQFRSGEDRPYQVYTTFEDITSRRRVEEQLRISEQKYRSLFETAGDALFMLECTGDDARFTDCNAAACAMFGRERGDLIGVTPAEVSPPTQPDGRASAEAARSYISAALAGKRQHFSWLHHRKDGTPFHTEVTLNRVTSGDQSHLQASVRDVSERVDAEEQRRKLEAGLRETQRIESLSVLAGGVAHDFNNLLTGVLGNAELALDSLSPVSPARTEVERIRAAAKASSCWNPSISLRSSERSGI